MCVIKDKLRATKRQIIEMAASCESRDPSGAINKDLIGHHWEHVAPGVRSILCALDGEGRDVTVVNCVFDAGAELPVHTHDRVENVHVVWGDLKEVLTGKKVYEGECLTVAGRQPHGFVSQRGCLLTISWRPAFESVEIETP